jgi:hypothetical protein
MLYDLDTFVNTNASTFEGSLEEFTSTFPAADCDETADPVLVYLRAGEPVAWYDLELECGFVA